MSFHEDMRQRSALLPISGRLMDRILRLPEGYEVQHVGVLPEHDAFAVIVKSAAFEVTPYGVKLPLMGINYSTCECCGGARLADVIYPVDPLQSMNVEIL